MSAWADPRAAVVSAPNLARPKAHTGNLPLDLRPKSRLTWFIRSPWTAAPPKMAKRGADEQLTREAEEAGARDRDDEVSRGQAV